MSAFLPTLLTWLQEFGYPILWLCACISALGVPLPTVLVLLAAGAFAALGNFNIVLLALIAFSASVCGDNLGYLLGRRVGTRILNWLARQRRLRIITPQRLKQAQESFNKNGAWAIFLSRFLLLALGGIINLLAGAEHYRYSRFLLYDVLGELLGALIPLLLGYLFSASWEMVGNIISLVSLLSLIFLVTIILTIRLIALLRQTAKQRTLLQRTAVEVHTPLQTSYGTPMQTSPDESPL